MRELIFVISHGQAGSEKVKGILPANYFNCKYVNSKRTQLTAFQNKILVINGAMTYQGLTPEVIDELHSKGNKIIHDPVDAYCYHNPWAQEGESPIPMHECVNEYLCTQKIDGVFAPNQIAAARVREITSAEVVALPHNIDTHFYTIPQDKNTAFSIGYGGNIYNNEFFAKPPPLLEINGQGHTDDVVRFCKYHSCHFSHRKSDTVDYKLKPASKVIVASVCESPIVCSRDWSNLDLLPDDYPLYVSDDRSDVEEKIEYAKSIFGTPKWQELLDIAKEVVNKTTLEGLENTYTTMFNKFDWSK